MSAFLLGLVSLLTGGVDCSVQPVPATKLVETCVKSQRVIHEVCESAVVSGYGLAVEIGAKALGVSKSCHDESVLECMQSETKSVKTDEFEFWQKQCS